MSCDDYSLIALAETTRPFVKSVRSEESNRYKKKRYKKLEKTENYDERKHQYLPRVPGTQASLNPINNLRNCFRKLNCFKSEQSEEEMPMVEIPRHKSIDIGVGLARRVSLFLFTRRTVCVHPYHPFTPEQTTRKIHIFLDEK